MGRRLLAVWVVLFAAYAATVGLDAVGHSDYGGDEPHHLLVASSLVEDGDVDLRDEYADRSYADWHPQPLEPRGRPVAGRVVEPQGLGFPLLVAPAFAAAGPVGVELLVAALAALAGALAYALALRVVPDPWALGAALACGLSPPLIAYGSAASPELPAAAALAGAALLALRLPAGPEDAAARGGARFRAVNLPALACLALLGLLPWLGPKFVPAGIVVGAFALRRLWRAGRRGLAVGAADVAAISLVVYVSVNGRLYGGPTPEAATLPGDPPAGAEFPLGYLDRTYRLAALLVDRESGLLRWAPVFALVFAGLWLLARARRAQLARALPAHAVVEATAALCAAALAAQMLVAAFLAPALSGPWFPPRHLVAVLPLAVPLVGWGLRRLPRTGGVLALLGIVASAWLYADVRLGDGGLAADRPPAPWGPLEQLFPLYGREPLPYVLTAVAGATAAVAVVVALRRSARPDIAASVR